MELGYLLPDGDHDGDLSLVLDFDLVLSCVSLPGETDWIIWRVGLGEGERCDWRHRRVRLISGGAGIPVEASYFM